MPEWRFEFNSRFPEEVEEAERVSQLLRRFTGPGDTVNERNVDGTIIITYERRRRNMDQVRSEMNQLSSGFPPRRPIPPPPPRSSRFLDPFSSRMEAAMQEGWLASIPLPLTHDAAVAVVPAGPNQNGDDMFEAMRQTVEYLRDIPPIPLDPPMSTTWKLQDVPKEPEPAPKSRFDLIEELFD